MKTEDLDKTVDTIVDDSHTSMDDFAKEMEAAVDEVVKEGKPSEEAELNDDGTPKAKKVVDDGTNTDLPDGKALPDEKKAKADEGKPDDKLDQPVITDSHIERAIKAGMTIADAKSFASVESFERVCSMLETKNGGDDSSAADAGSGDENNVLDSIPDLDPDEYDEAIVNAFKSVKNVLKQQLAVNADLRQRGTQSEVDWVDAQIQGLGEQYAEAVGAGAKTALAPGSAQATKRAEVERKFKALEAGYKATGDDVARDAVFKEAVSLTLGDVAAKADAAKKEAALATRKKQMLNRANGANVASKKDAFDEAAEEIDRKFFGKN